MATETAHTRFSDIVLDNIELSASAKGVFVTIGFLGNGCSMVSILEQSSDDAAQIQRALDELVNAGYISLEDGNVHIKSASTFGIIA